MPFGQRVVFALAQGTTAPPARRVVVGAQPRSGWDRRSGLRIGEPCRATVILSASEGSWYTPIVNHLLINTSRRGGAFLYSRRGLRLWRRGAYGPVLTHGPRVVAADAAGAKAVEGAPLKKEGAPL